MITFDPFIHSLNTSQKMPEEIYGANKLQVGKKKKKKLDKFMCSFVFPPPLIKRKDQQEN